MRHGMMDAVLVQATSISFSMAASRGYNLRSEAGKVYGHPGGTFVCPAKKGYPLTGLLWSPVFCIFSVQSNMYGV